MASKAKSGMSAVRMFQEDVLVPPNTFVVGSAATFESAIRDGKGHSELHAAVINETSGTLRILFGWQSAGPFTLDIDVPTAVDPVSGLHTASLKCSIRKRFYRVQFVPDATLGASFELGAFFQPRSSGDPVVFAGGINVGVNSKIVGNTQVPVTETTTPLAGSATFSGGEYDMTEYEAIGASLTLIGGGAPSSVTVRFQQRIAAGTFRNADVVILPVGAGATVNFDRVWSVTRQFARVQIEETLGAALATTELTTMRKPIS